MNRAFSLVELLIVIAIILTLASILLPVASQSKVEAQRTLCVSNMRQVYVAMKMYEADFGGYPTPLAGPFADRFYTGGTLLCPATDMNKSSSFVQYQALSFDDDLFGDQWRQCFDIRGQGMPIVFDLWHGRHFTAPAVGKHWQPVGWTGMVVREHGGLQKLDEGTLMKVYMPQLFDPRPEFPCASEPSPLFNL